MINRNLVIKKLRCKNPNAQAYRVFWSDEIQYLGYFLVDSDDRITFAHKLLNKELNQWKDFPKMVTKPLTRNTMIELTHLFSGGVPHKVTFEGFEFNNINHNSELVDDVINASIPGKYIKNSLLKILENPVYSVDDQIFNAFMKRD